MQAQYCTSDPQEIIPVCLPCSFNGSLGVHRRWQLERGDWTGCHLRSGQYDNNHVLMKTQCISYSTGTLPLAKERQSSILKETKIWALNNNKKEFQLSLKNNMQMLLSIVAIRGTLSGRQNMSFVLLHSLCTNTILRVLVCACFTCYGRQGIVWKKKQLCKSLILERNKAKSHHRIFLFSSVWLAEIG